MKLAYNSAVLVLAVGLFLPTARAGEQRPIVVVFNVEATGVRLSKQYLNGLADYLSSRLTESGAYQVVPRDQVKQRLVQQKKGSYKECYDQSCQIEIGKELAAEKTLSTKVIKLGNRCTVTLTFYDLKKSTTESAATQHGQCGENKVIESVDKALAKLFGDDVDLPPDVDDTPAPSSDDKNYKRALNQAWRKLARAVRKGTTEQKLEQYQKFLTDYPVDNPHAGKVQKSIDALESRIEKEETARREVEEKKAALEAKRARAKEIQAAYDQAKNKKGSASTQLQSWESFVSDYPDDNPYLKTAKRKITSLEPQAEKEEARREAEAEERERLARIEAEKKAAEEKARIEKLAKTKDVKQPGTNLYWLRCPLGQKWTGSSCEGKASKMNWKKAMNACPSGYRLPTREEFVSLLGGCDADVRGGGKGDCNECAKSSRCSSMSGEDDWYYWSSSSYAADSSFAWVVRFGNGRVFDGAKDDVDHVRCVRGGP